MKIRLFIFLVFSVISCTSNNQVSYLTNDYQATITADSKGIYTKNYNFSPDQLFPKDNWKGNWIWLNKTKYNKYQDTYTTWINNSPPREHYRVLFRKEFTIKKLPSLAILSITADVSFKAYINGKFICQGPANIGSDYADTKPRSPISA